MAKALIGYTGFVGTTLMKQTQFDDFYRSTNISDIKGKKFDLVVCAGAPRRNGLPMPIHKETVRKLTH
jgi:hypothetical protein